MFQTEVAGQSEFVETKTSSTQKHHVHHHHPHSKTVTKVEEATVAYSDSGPTQLPASIQVRSLLEVMVNQVDFTSEGGKMMFKRDFMSPPSRAVMQDLFWYITCMKCKKDYEQEKEKMYSRIAQNYVRFFDRVKRHRKDAVMLRYYRVLALVLVEAFFQAYPKSRLSYDQLAFKGEIVDLCGM